MDATVREALKVLEDPAAGVVAKVKAAYSLPPELREAVRDDLAALDRTLQDVPLSVFEPHSEPQRAFLEAKTRVQAAFAGNRFGKTTSLVVKALCQVSRREALPPHLLPLKTRDATELGRPIAGRIVSPSFSATVEGVILPTFRKWATVSEWRGGSFEKAWDKQLRIIRFADGSWVQVMSYDQDPSLFGGTALDFVGYDEPPPRLIREECQMRLVDYGGWEMFALTPLEGAGWMRKAVWARRDDPDVTVVTGSIHDNPVLDQAAKDAALAGSESDMRRRAKEFGEFVDFGENLIYPDFHDAQVDPPTKEHVRSLPDIAVGIDPGMRNAGFVFVGFDQDNTALVFAARKLQNATPKQYAQLIRSVLETWGIPLERVRFVIDPAARNRELATGQNVEALLQREGIFCVHGQNAVEAGVQQVRGRLSTKGLLVSRECRELFDEAEDYRTERKPDGEFHVVKENDHLLDPLRYVCMSRLYAPMLAPTPTKHRDPTKSWSPFPTGRDRPTAPTGAFT